MSALTESTCKCGIVPTEMDEHAGRVLQARFSQYKLAVEMADKLSQRRATANTFFLTVNTAVFTLVALFWELRAEAPKASILAPASIAILQTIAWRSLLDRYRTLAGEKWRVIGQLEENLLSSPFTAEDTDKVKNLTDVELWVPALFGAVYIAGAGAVLIF